MLNFDLTDELRRKLQKISKKAPKTTQIINNKIQQVISNDLETINRYKNLRHDLKDYKRVHIHKSFVLIFKVYKEKNFVLFTDFEHHDRIY